MKYEYKNELINSNQKDKGRRDEIEENIHYLGEINELLS